jgi:aryl-alcohol dehydrogenase-like predicted oxidoreductase
MLAEAIGVAALDAPETKAQHESLDDIYRRYESRRDAATSTFVGEIQMQYSLLGNTGLVVSRLGFGAGTFIQKDPKDLVANRNMAGYYTVGKKLAADMVSLAIDQGVTLFDTGDVYADGESEILLGAALKPHRQKVIVTTKVGSRTGTDLTQSGLSRRHILWSVDQSLKRLGTDWIDIYIAHREDPYTPIEETLDALDAVVRSGKVRYIGFSNWSAWNAAAALEIQKARGLARFTHGQMYYSLLCRDIERDVIPMLKRNGLGLTVWSPLAFGFLSGKYTRENLKNPENRYSSLDILPFDKEHGFRLVEQMRAIATTHNSSVPKVALAWLLAQPSLTSVLVGASKLQQLEDNLGAADLQLSKADLDDLGAATALAPTYPNWYIEALSDGQMREALRHSAV